MPENHPGLVSYGNRSLVGCQVSGVGYQVSGIRWHKALGQRAKGGRSRPLLTEISTLLSRDRFLLLQHRSDGFENRLDAPPGTGGGVVVGVPPAVGVILKAQLAPSRPAGSLASRSPAAPRTVCRVV